MAGRYGARWITNLLPAAAACAASDPTGGKHVEPGAGSAGVEGS